jgi:hypothetical protein
MSDERKKPEEEEEREDEARQPEGDPGERFRRLTGSLESPAEKEEWDGEWLEQESSKVEREPAEDRPTGEEPSPSYEPDRLVFDPDKRDHFPGITDTDIMAAAAPVETSLSSAPPAEEPAPPVEEQIPNKEETSERTPTPPPPLGTTPMRKPPKLDAQDMPLPQRVPLSDTGATRVTSIGTDSGPVKSAKSGRPPTPPKRGWRGMSCLYRLVITGAFMGVLVGCLAASYMLLTYYQIRATLPDIGDLQSNASQFETTRILDRRPAHLCKTGRYLPLPGSRHHRHRG